MHNSIINIMAKRKLTYIQYANYLIQKIIEGKIGHDDDRVIDFFISLTEKESENIKYLTKYKNIEGNMSISAYKNP